MKYAIGSSPATKAQAEGAAKGGGRSRRTGGAKDASRDATDKSTSPRATRRPQMPPEYFACPTKSPVFARAGITPSKTERRLRPAYHEPQRHLRRPTAVTPRTPECGPSLPPAFLGAVLRAVLALMIDGCDSLGPGLGHHRRRHRAQFTVGVFLGSAGDLRSGHRLPRVGAFSRTPSAQRHNTDGTLHAGRVGHDLADSAFCWQPRVWFASTRRRCLQSAGRRGVGVG